MREPLVIDLHCNDMTPHTFVFFFTFPQPHGPVPTLKPRARAGQDDASSTKSLQQSSSVAEEEEEMPLARVRDSAIAEKACLTNFP